MTVAALATLVLAFALAAGSVVAQTAPTGWSPAPRDVEFRSDDDGFTYASAPVDDPQTERLEGEFRLDQVSMAWTYRANATSVPFTSRLVVLALLEWRDADQDGRFGVGDSVVRRQRVDALENASLETLPRAGGGHVVHATYPFPGGKPGPLDPLTGRRVLSDAALTLSFHVLEGPAIVAGLTTDATRLPLEVRIEKWPRTQAGSMFGLEIVLQSDGAMRLDAQAWRSLGPIAEHDASWATAYTYNGTKHLARVAGLQRTGPTGDGPTDAATTLFAAYEPGDIVHALSLGTQPRSQGLADLPPVIQQVLGDPRTYLGGMATALLIVSLTAARKVRRGS